MGTPVTYGTFNLNDGINYFVLKRDISMVPTNPTMFKIGRLEGMKKTGEAINERPISLDVRILGVSRTDLESKIDALQMALSLRNQQFAVRSNDSRYFLADCTSFNANFSPGNILSTTATIGFVCYQPFAYDASSSVIDSGLVTMAFNAPTSNYQYSQIISAGGTTFTYPTIRITQQTPVVSTTLTVQLNNNSSYTSLSVAALTVPLNGGDTLIIGTGITKKSVVVTLAVPIGATAVSVAQFTANATYTVGTGVNKDLSLTSIQITQATDNRVLLMTSNLPTVYGDYIDVNSNPFDYSNGYTAILNSGTTLSTILGVFPILQAFSTSFIFNITANSVPKIDISWTFTNRWLS